MNHLDEYVFPFMNSREIERLEIEQKVLNYYHYGSQILCGQFIESTSANWPSNTQKKIKMTQWNLYILDFTQKKKKIDIKLQPNVWLFAYADAYQGNAHGTSWAIQLYS